MIQCPHCNKTFAPEYLEEVVDSNLIISRQSRERGSWRDVYNNIINGRAYMLFDVGDSIECVLKNGNKVTIDVAGIDIYNKNEVIFCFHNVFDKYYMNERPTNAGGFPKADMLNYLDDIYDQLPDDLQDIISPRHITQEIRGERSDCDVKLWLPSLVEVFGDRYAEYDCEAQGESNKQLPIFANPENIIRFFNGETLRYWLRSAVTGGTNYFYYVTAAGNTGSANASIAYGVLPCFSISKK